MTQEQCRRSDAIDAILDEVREELQAATPEQFERKLAAIRLAIDKKERRKADNSERYRAYKDLGICPVCGVNDLLPGFKSRCATCVRTKQKCGACRQVGHDVRQCQEGK